MSCYKSNCSFVAVIVGIVAGVILGVLYSLGFVATGILFWSYLAIGVAGVLLSPLYAASASRHGTNRCFCAFGGLLLTAAFGAILAAAIGLLVAGPASTVVVAIVVGVATFFVATLLAAVACFVNCLLDSCLLGD